MSRQLPDVRRRVRAWRPRVRERLVDYAVRRRLRRDGMSVELLPSVLRRHVNAVGMDPPALDSLLLSVRSMDDWALRWGEAGRGYASEGDLERAWRSLLIGQRAFTQRTPEREAMWREGCELYHQAHPEVERVSFSFPYGTVRGLFDAAPRDPADDAPLLVLFTGLGVVAEELHDVAQAVRSLDVATLRLDSPGWGASDLRIEEATALHAIDVVEAVAERWPQRRLITAGTCIGGIFAALTAASHRVEGAISVSPPWMLENSLHRWPRPVRDLLCEAIGDPWHIASHDLARVWAQRRDVVRTADVPIHIHAGGRDRMVPLSDLEQLRASAPNATLTVHDDQPHACPTILERILIADVERLLAAERRTAVQIQRSENRIRDMSEVRNS